VIEIGRPRPSSSLRVAILLLLIGVGLLIILNRNAPPERPSLGTGTSSETLTVPESPTTAPAQATTTPTSAPATTEATTATTAPAASCARSNSCRDGPGERYGVTIARTIAAKAAGMVGTATAARSDIPYLDMTRRLVSCLATSLAVAITVSMVACSGSGYHYV